MPVRRLALAAAVTAAVAALVPAVPSRAMPLTADVTKSVGLLMPAEASPAMDGPRHRFSIDLDIAGLIGGLAAMVIHRGAPRPVVFDVADEDVLDMTTAAGGPVPETWDADDSLALLTEALIVSLAGNLPAFVRAGSLPGIEVSG